MLTLIWAPFQHKTVLVRFPIKLVRSPYFIIWCGRGQYIDWRKMGMIVKCKPLKSWNHIHRLSKDQFLCSFIKQCKTQHWCVWCCPWLHSYHGNHRSHLIGCHKRPPGVSAWVAWSAEVKWDQRSQVTTDFCCWLEQGRWGKRLSSMNREIPCWHSLMLFKIAMFQLFGNFQRHEKNHRNHSPWVLKVTKVWWEGWAWLVEFLLGFHVQLDFVSLNEKWKTAKGFN